MKTRITRRAGLSVAALFALALSGVCAGIAQATPPTAAPGGPGDFLTVVGKRTVWASQIAKPAPPPVVAPRHDPNHEFVIIENKRVVRRTSAPTVPVPPPTAAQLVAQPHIHTDGHLMIDHKTVRWIAHDHPAPVMQNAPIATVTEIAEATVSGQ